MLVINTVRRHYIGKSLQLATFFSNIRKKRLAVAIRMQRYKSGSLPWKSVKETLEAISRYQ